MPTRNINLTDRYDRFVTQQIKSGRFQNASEVMRAGLQLLESEMRENEVKLRALQTMARESYKNAREGNGTKISRRSQLQDFVAQIGRQVSKTAKRRSKGA